MKRFISTLVFLVFTVSFAVADVYEFTEAELEEFVTGIAVGVTEEKDLEIADLIMEHDLEIVDKNLEITTLDIDKKALQEEVDLLEEVNENQSKILQWAAPAIVTSVLIGVLTGVLIAGQF